LNTWKEKKYASISKLPEYQILSQEYELCEVRMPVLKATKIEY
jgi:hypothetical protein